MANSDKGETARPRMTIEAKAREVGREEEKPKRQRAAQKPAAASVKSPPEPPKPAKPAGEAAKAAKSEKPEKPEKPSASSPSRPLLPKSLVPLMITGTAAALAAVVLVFAILAGLRYGSDATSRALSGLAGAGEAREQARAAGDQVSALAASLDEIRTEAAGVREIENRLEDLTARLSALQSDIEGLAGDRAAAVETATRDREAAGERLERIEAQIAALDAAGVAATQSVEELRRDFTSAAESGVSAAAVATRVSQEASRIDSLAGRVSGVEQTLSLANGTAEAAREAAAEITGRQEALESRLGELAGELRDRTAAVAQSLEGRVARLETAAQRLAARIDRLATPGAIAVHSALAARAAAGEPFGRELAALRNDLGEIAEVSALAEYADRAVPTVDQLTARLDRLPTADPAELGDDVTDRVEDGLFARLLDRAGDAVRVSRRGEGARGGALDRAAERLGEGDLAGAIAVVGGLPATPARDRWMADAEARRAVDEGVAALGALLDARLAGTGNG